MSVDFNCMLQRLAEKSSSVKRSKMARMRTDELLLSKNRVMLGRQRLFVEGLSETSNDSLFKLQPY